MRGGGRLRANPGGLNIKTLGRREGAGKIKGLRRGGFGPRRRAAGPAGPATLLFAPRSGANGWATRPA